MNLTLATNDEACSFLASRIRSERLRQGYTQSTMSEKSGIALRTYKRIELTGNGSIQNLILILRTLDRIRGVELLLPPNSPTTRPSITDRIQLVAEANQKSRF